MTDNESRIQRERDITLRLVREAINRGYNVSVFDGEEWPVKRSTSESEIMSWAHEVDEMTLQFRAQSDDTRIGSVLLIFGNDDDLISDCTDTRLIRSLVDSLRIE